MRANNGELVARVWNELFQDNPTNFFNERINKKAYLEAMAGAAGFSPDVILKVDSPLVSSHQCIHSLEPIPNYFGYKCAHCGIEFSELELFSNKRVDSQADPTIHFSINNEGVAQWL